MDPATIALMALQLASLGANLGFKTMASSKAEKYEKEKSDFEKKMLKKQEREARRAALARALKTKGFESMPKAYYGPEAPSTAAEQIGAGISDILGQIGATGLSKWEAK